MEQRTWANDAFRRLSERLPLIGFDQLVTLINQPALAEESIQQVILEEIEQDCERRLRLREAAKQLVEAIKAEQISAYGRRDEVGALHERIPLTIFMSPRVTVTIHDRVQESENLLNGHINGRPGYSLVQFRKTEVLGLWPPPRSNSPPSIPIAKLRDDYASFVAKHKQAGTRPTVPETKKAMAEASPNHAPPTDAMVDSLRRNPPTPKSWGKQGRHRQKSN